VVSGPHLLPYRKKNTMEVNGVQKKSGYKHSSKYLALRSAEKNAYSVGTT